MGKAAMKQAVTRQVVRGPAARGQAADELQENKLQLVICKGLSALQGSGVKARRVRIKVKIL